MALRGRLRIEGTLEAVADARVWLALDTEAETGARTASRSDSDGSFRLSASDAERTGVLYVVAVGRRFWSAPLMSVPEVNGVREVFLPSGGEIRGVVVDPTDRPIPGVRVQARAEHAEDVGWATDPTGWGSDQVPDLAEAESDATGAFVLAGLGLHDYELHARKVGFTGPSQGAARPTARPADDRPTIVRLVLQPLYEARAVAVDEITREPVRSVSIHVRMVENEPWAYGAIPSAPRASKEQGADLLDAPATARATLWKAGEEDVRTPIEFALRAIGYEERVVALTPVPFGTAVDTVVEMRRSSAAPLAPIRFRLVLGQETGGPSGLFSCQLSDGPHMARAPQFRVRFVSGVATEPVHLPRGQYKVVLRGAAGNTLLWHNPLGSKSHSFDVKDESAAFVDLPCAGSLVCVRPTLAGGQPLREFRLSMETSHYSGYVSTWEYDIPRDTCAGETAQPAFAFWLPAGKCSLWVARRGYASAGTEMEIPREGARLVWAPVLRLPGPK